MGFDVYATEVGNDCRSLVEGNLDELIEVDDGSWEQVSALPSTGRIARVGLDRVRPHKPG